MMKHVLRVCKLNRLVWLGYFLVLLAVALPQGLTTPLSLYKGHPACTPELTLAVFTCQSVEPVRPLSKTDQIISLYQLNDPATVAQAGKNIAEKGIFPERHSPPGLMLSYALLYKISPDLPVALIAVLVACGLWAAVFTQAAFALKRQAVPILMVFGLPLFFLVLNGFKQLVTVQVFNTETYSIALFLLGLGTLFRAASCRDKKKAIYAGLLLALSAYMRAQTDLVMTFAMWLLVSGMVVFLLYQIVCKKVRLNKALLKATISQHQWIYAMIVALVSYHAITLPYRAYNDFHWVRYHKNPVWSLIWEKKENISPPLQFLLGSGGIAGCEIDKERCDYIHQTRALQGVVFFLIKIIIISPLHHWRSTLFNG